jgi:hypothetical protein
MGVQGGANINAPIDQSTTNTGIDTANTAPLALGLTATANSFLIAAFAADKGTGAVNQWTALAGPMTDQFDLGVNPTNAHLLAYQANVSGVIANKGSTATGAAPLDWSASLISVKR